MPSVIDTQAMLVPNQMLLTAHEAFVLAGNLNTLRGRHVDEIVITTTGGKTVKIRRDGVTNIAHTLSQAVTDTTWAENVVVSLAGHNLIRLRDALFEFGKTKSEYVLAVPQSAVNSIRFTLTP